MSGERAIVTGAGGGIGRATTARLLGQGYEVVAVDRRAEVLERLTAELGAGARLRAIAADVADAAGLARALRDVGPLRAVVAGAGICSQARLGDPDCDQVWREVLSVNLDGVWNTFRATVPSLVDGGRAVAVSSGLGKLGRAGYGAYTASKHGVLGLVKCLAQELAPRGITVNGVCPGWVATEMAQADLVRTAQRAGSTVEEVRRAALAGIPLGRFVEADEVAALICWLVSGDASAITGQAYNISCGEFFA
jgi:NAD(P)-dependent dehydrogenase (short-subunit alcohol dehydrogenase family)